MKVLLHVCNMRKHLWVQIISLFIEDIYHQAMAGELCNYLVFDLCLIFNAKQESLNTDVFINIIPM